MFGLQMTVIITRLLKSMEEKVRSRVVFLKNARKIWDILKEVYYNEMNIFRVLKLYECLFTIQRSIET